MSSSVSLLPYAMNSHLKHIWREIYVFSDALCAWVVASHHSFSYIIFTVKHKNKLQGFCWPKSTPCMLGRVAETFIVDRRGKFRLGRVGSPTDKSCLLTLKCKSMLYELGLDILFSKCFFTQNVLDSTSASLSLLILMTKKKAFWF